MWAKDYKGQVNLAVDGVVTELGKQYEMAARWLVYEKVSIVFSVLSSFVEWWYLRAARSRQRWVAVGSEARTLGRPRLGGFEGLFSGVKKCFRNGLAAFASNNRRSFPDLMFLNREWAITVLFSSASVSYHLFYG